MGGGLREAARGRPPGCSEWFGGFEAGLFGGELLLELSPKLQQIKFRSKDAAARAFACTQRLTRAGFVLGHRHRGDRRGACGVNTACKSGATRIRAAGTLTLPDSALSAVFFRSIPPRRPSTASPPVLRWCRTQDEMPPSPDRGSRAED